MRLYLARTRATQARCSLVDRYAHTEFLADPNYLSLVVITPGSPPHVSDKTPITVWNLPEFSLSGVLINEVLEKLYTVLSSGAVQVQQPGLSFCGR